MDLDSTEDVFAQLEGLEVHRISAPQCCYKPEGAAHIAANVTTETLVTICTGCYGQALASLPPDRGTKVFMLPELVEQALS
jgi:oxalate decarboxylase/phosphoglucose isomerase-like protein (cupin superfamily)